MSYYNSKNIQVFPTSKRDDKYTLTSKSGAYLSNIVGIKNNLVDIKSYIVDISIINNKLNSTFYIAGYRFEISNIDLNGLSLTGKYLQAHIKLTQSQQVEENKSLLTLLDNDIQDLTSDDNNFYYIGLDLQVNDKKELDNDNNYYVTLLENGEINEDNKLHINERSLVIDDGELIQEYAYLILNSNNSIIGLTPLIQSLYIYTPNQTDVPEFMDGVLNINKGTQIRFDAFKNKTILKEVNIYNNIKEIYSDSYSNIAPFCGCSNIEKIVIPFIGNKEHTSTDTYQYPFGYIFGQLYYQGGTATTQSYYGSSTSSTTSTTYYIPTSLKEVVITDSGYIPAGSFDGCQMLTKITLPDTITEIGNFAFRNCTNLDYINLPISINKINPVTFFGCSSLKGITIPNSVESIGKRAFSGCSSLQNVYYNDTIEDWNKITKDNSWNENTGTYIIHCTNGDIMK